MLYVGPSLFQCQRQSSQGTRQRHGIGLILRRGVAEAGSALQQKRHGVRFGEDVQRQWLDAMPVRQARGDQHMATLQSRQEVFHGLRCGIGIDVVEDQQPAIFVFQPA